MSWEAMAMTGLSIGVVGSAVLGSETGVAASTSVTKANVLFVSVFSGAAQLFQPLIFLDSKILMVGMLVELQVVL